MTPVIDSPREEDESVTRPDSKSDMINPLTVSSKVEPTITLTDMEPEQPISEVYSKAELSEEIYIE